MQLDIVGQAALFAFKYQYAVATKKLAEFVSVAQFALAIPPSLL